MRWKCRNLQTKSCANVICKRSRIITATFIASDVTISFMNNICLCLLVRTVLVLTNSCKNFKILLVVLPHSLCVKMQKSAKAVGCYTLLLVRRSCIFWWRNSAHGIWQAQLTGVKLTTSYYRSIFALQDGDCNHRNVENDVIFATICIQK